MKLDMNVKTLFQIALAFAPDSIVRAVSAVEQTVTASGPDKKAKALAIASEGLGLLNDLAKTDLSKHPEFVAAMGKINDAVVEVANIVSKLAPAA